MSCQYCNKKHSIHARCLARETAYKEILNKDFLYQEYIINKKSLPELSILLGIRVKRIHKALVEFGFNRTVKEATSLPERKKKSETTCLERTGVPHNFCKNSPSRIAWQKKMFEEEGITCSLQRESVKEQIKKTMLEKYRDENFKDARARGAKVFSKLNAELAFELQLAKIKFKVEFKLSKESGFFYSYDFVINNLLIEINGDYWHGNPKIYKESDIILKGSSKELRVGDKWAYDALKKETALKAKYDFITIWESDWKEDKQKCMEQIRNAIIKDKNNQKN